MTTPTPKKARFGWFTRRSLPTKIGLSLIGCAVLLFIIGVTFFATDDAAVTRQCQDAVQAQLKAPTTAEFSFEPRIVKTDHTHWIILGNVTAQNSFGAPLTNTYSCNMTKSGDGWHVTDASLSD